MSNNDHIKYYNSENVEVPSTTTVLKLYAKHLEPWANWLGKTGKDYKTFLQEKADFGTYIHSVCEKFFSSTMEVDTHPDTKFISIQDYVTLQEHFQQLKDKLNSMGYIPYAQELVIHGEKYGGTIDLLFYNPTTNDYILIDLKTAKATYNTMYMQMMAYCDLLKEKHDITVSSVGIFLVLREPDDPQFCKLYDTSSDDMQHYRYIFKNLLNIYYLLNDDERKKLIS